MPFVTMTDPRSPTRNRFVEAGLLLCILAVAAALRVHGIGFGLPALNDPDEPLFVMTAIDMLRNHNLNPHWFGHPGTITLYSIALVGLGVGGTGIATGQYAGVDGFVSAVYADPAILFVPARLFFAAWGVACVWLTWRLGKRIGGARVGLVAAGLLAVNAVHIHYSQVVRTDVQASVFMLAALLASLSAADKGRLRDYALAGLFVGLGAATKWPAALVAVAPLCVALWRQARWRDGVRGLGLFAACAIAALLLASPYLLLDYPTALRHLTAEGRSMHPGATGDGLLGNLGWYLQGPLLGSLGPVGLALSAIGLVVLPMRFPRAALAIMPAFLAVLIATCAQSLRWERWVIPLLPFLALGAAIAIGAIGAALRGRLRAKKLRWFEPAAALLVALPMLLAALADVEARTHDTRQLALAWVRAHVPRGGTILVEHAGFDLQQGGWRLRFPLGSAGCLDAAAVISGKIKSSQIESARGGAPLIDLGHVATDRLDSCRADYAILSHWATYRAAPRAFPEALAKYRALARGGHVETVILPVPGRHAGPTLYILRLRR